MFVLQEAAAAKEKSQRDNNKSFFRNLKVKLNKGKWASISTSRPSMVSSDTPVVRTLFLLFHQRLAKQWALARAL